MATARLITRICIYNIVSAASSKISADPLNEYMNSSHHWMSSRISGDITRLWLAARRGHIASIIRRMNTLPPYNTLAAQLSFPAKDCICFLLARRRLVMACNSCLRDNHLSCGRRFVMFVVSISIPKNVIHCTGSTTLFQLILNPNCLNNVIKVLSAVAHSFTVRPQTKKSSK